MAPLPGYFRTLLDKNPSVKARDLVAAGNAARLLGRYEDAVRYYDRALALKSDQVDVYILKAAALLGMGQPAQALEQLNVVLGRFHRDEYWPHRFAGEALAAMDRPAEALVHYQRALELSPDSHELRYELGLLYERLGELEKARAWWEDYLARQPDGPLAAVARQHLEATIHD